MKKLEECAVLEYQQNRQKPQKYQIPDNCYVDWYKKGAEEAQKWFNPSEVLPNHKEVVLAKIPLLNYPLLFAYSKIENRWFQFEEGDFYISEVDPIVWRPIERT